MAGFVVVKGRFGMGGRIAVVLSAWSYAQRTGRQLIVDWNDFAYFSPGVGDVYRSCFAAPVTSDVTLDQLGDCSVFPKIWAGKLLDYRNDIAAEIMPYELSFCTPPGLGDIEASAADVVVITRNDPMNTLRGLYRSLQLAEPIQRQVDVLGAAFQIEDRVGIQVRHGNGEHLVVPADTTWFRERIQPLVDGSAPLRLLVASDSRLVVDEFEAWFADVAHTPKWYPDPHSGSMHQNAECPNRFENGVDAIVDMWLLARCRHLLLCRGFFGETVRNLARDSGTRVELYPGKIHPTAAEKVGWDNPI